MKRNHVPPLLLLAISGLLALNIVVSLLRPSGARAETHEYKVEPVIYPPSAREMQLQIREHTEKGWELVTIHAPANRGLQIYMVFRK